MSPAKRPQMTLDGYIRVSQTRGREGDSFISPRVQRESIQHWATGRGVTIGEWHEDLDQSGGKLSRPGLDAILDRIRLGQTGGIAVAHLDRLSRAGVGDALALVREIHDLGAEIAIVDLGIDPTTPVGKFAITILLALAAMQLEQYKEKWSVSRGHAIRRGIHFSAPFGYEKPGPAEPLVPDPTTGPLVRRAFELRAAGESWHKIAACMNEKHPPTRAARWTHSGIVHVIRNRAYLGEAYHGQHVQPNAHPPLVTLDLWQAANDVTGVTPPRGKSEGLLLSGMIRCSGCRYVMTSGASRAGARIYRCRRDYGAGRCPAPCTISHNIIEEFVENAFLERYGSEELSGVISTQTVASARTDLLQAEEELREFRDNQRIAKALETADPDAFVAGLEARAQCVVEARQRLQAVKVQAVGFDVPDAGTYFDLSIAERRQLLRAGIGAVFVRRSTERRRTPDPAKRVLILWPGSEPSDLPGRGTPTKGIIPFDW